MNEESEQKSCHLVWPQEGMGERTAPASSLAWHSAKFTSPHGFVLIISSTFVCSVSTRLEIVRQLYNFNM